MRSSRVSGGEMYRNERTRLTPCSNTKCTRKVWCGVSVGYLASSSNRRLHPKRCSKKRSSVPSGNKKMSGIRHEGRGLNGASHNTTTPQNHILAYIILYLHCMCLVCPLRASLWSSGRIWRHLGSSQPTPTLSHPANCRGRNTEGWLRVVKDFYPRIVRLCNKLGYSLKMYPARAVHGTHAPRVVY